MEQSPIKLIIAQRAW